jgi:virulence-associated protein VapD
MYTKPVNNIQNKRNSVDTNLYTTMSGSNLPQGNTRVYAISFDMDIESLKQSYGDPYNNAYGEIRKVLSSHGFIPQQGSVYFAKDNTINAVTCVLAVQDLSKRFPWFAASVRDIRMLRIEEFNDLLPAVQASLPTTS